MPPDSTNSTCSFEVLRYYGRLATTVFTRCSKLPNTRILRTFKSVPSLPPVRLATSAGRRLLKVRSVASYLKSSTEDTAIAMQLLQECAPKEREALLRFYCEREDPAKIATDIGLTSEAFRAMRMRLLDQFISRRNSGTR